MHPSAAHPTAGGTSLATPDALAENKRVAEELRSGAAWLSRTPIAGLSTISRLALARILREQADRAEKEIGLWIAPPRGWSEHGGVAHDYPELLPGLIEKHFGAALALVESLDTDTAPDAPTPDQRPGDLAEEDTR